jgi:hypothetical protein
MLNVTAHKVTTMIKKFKLRNKLSCALRVNKLRCALRVNGAFQVALCQKKAFFFPNGK